MNGCPDREAHLERIHDLLDGLVPKAEAERLRRHLAGCADCRAEMMTFQRVFGSLERLPLAVVRPELTERILARVLPSRRRRRHRVAVIGWSYAACLAACAGLAGGIAAQPAARAFVEHTAGGVSHRVVEGLSFITHLTAVAVLGVAGGLDALAATGERFAPIGRALNAVLTTPSFAAALLTALAVSSALLWWLRPATVRRRRSGSTDIGILGFWGLS